MVAYVKSLGQNRGLLLLIACSLLLGGGQGCKPKIPPEQGTVAQATPKDPPPPQSKPATNDSDDPQPEPGDTSPRIPGFVTEQNRKNFLSMKFLFVENGPPAPMIATPSGLKYRIIEPGTGKPVTPHCRFTANYIGNLENGANFGNFLTFGKIGDIPEQQLFPVIYNMADQVKGWQEGLPFIKEGGLIELEVPPELGFGENGKEKVPPNAKLFYIVRVMTVDPVLFDEQARRIIKSESFQSTKSGVFYKFIKQSEGKTGRKPSFTDVVTINYSVSRIDGTKYIDTYESGKPETTSVVKLVKGMAEAVKMISEGESIELILIPSLAYGRHSQTDDVPDSVFVRVRMDLLKIEPNQKLRLPKRKEPISQEGSSQPSGKSVEAPSASQSGESTEAKPKDSPQPPATDSAKPDEAAPEKTTPEKTAN